MTQYQDQVTWIALGSMVGVLYVMAMVLVVCFCWGNRIRACRTLLMRVPFLKTWVQEPNDNLDDLEEVKASHSQNLQHARGTKGEGAVLGVKQKPVLGVKQEAVLGVKQEAVMGVKQEAAVFKPPHSGYRWKMMWRERRARSKARMQQKHEERKKRLAEIEKEREEQEEEEEQTSDASDTSDTSEISESDTSSLTEDSD